MGRLRNPNDALVIEPHLARAILLTQPPEWAAVRRRFNKEADELATSGIDVARALFDNNRKRPHTTTLLNTLQVNDGV